MGSNLTSLYPFVNYLFYTSLWIPLFFIVFILSSGRVSNLPAASPTDRSRRPSLYGHGAVFSRGLRAADARVQPVRPHGLGGDRPLLVGRHDPARHERVPLDVSVLRDSAKRAGAPREAHLPGQSGLRSGEG